MEGERASEGEKGRREREGERIFAAIIITTSVSDFRILFPWQLALFT